MFIKTPILKDKFICYDIKFNNWKWLAVSISGYQENIIDNGLMTTWSKRNDEFIFAPDANEYYWVYGYWRSIDLNSVEFSEIIKELSEYLLFM